jgi:succinate dehydrogenase/fumarate reductase flavoprotein subunit
MWNHLLVVRTEEGINSCLKELERIEVELLPQARIEGPKEAGKYLELMNLFQAAKIICYAARMRKESRGSHYRDDFPRRDDANWDKSIIIRKTEETMVSSFRMLGQS